MTQNNNRDLWVVFRHGLLNKEAFNREVLRINSLLFDLERLDNFVKCHELHNIDKHRVVNRSVDIKKFIRKNKDQPFVFIFNCN